MIERKCEMKPFNLEKALAGDPVVTRDGIPVTEIVRFNGLPHDRRLYGIINGGLVSFLDNGRFSVYEFSETKYDLFMAPKIVKKSGWINIYHDGGCGRMVSALRIDADKMADEHRVACVYVEWEEEEE